MDKRKPIFLIEQVRKSNVRDSKYKEYVDAATFFKQLAVREISGSHGGENQYDSLLGHRSV
jgi:hypothetical protein